MAYLLIPGRHLINTEFQDRYFPEILQKTVEALALDGTCRVPADQKIDEIVFAITSANQAYSRYNPVPFYARAIALDRFAQTLKAQFDVRYRLVQIPHMQPSPRFAETLLKEIQEGTYDHLKLTPENTILLCSTSAVMKLYRDLGFAILPAEYDLEKQAYKEKAPIDVLRDLFDTPGDWHGKSGLSRTTQTVWEDFPDIPFDIARIWRDPLLTESGSLTETRNYSTYASGMNHSALMKVKYQDIREAVVPGRIVDEGCADGALIVELSKDFPDSDLIGIEITSEFLARCLERLRAGEFGQSFVHFHQRNLMHPIFEDDSISCTICNSTTHEIWSYGEGKKSLTNYLAMKFKQLQPGGRIIIRDVVGPEKKDREVYLWADPDNGSNEDPYKQFDTPADLAPYLGALSTAARFRRFAHQYLADMRAARRRGAESTIVFREEDVDGKHYFVLSLKDATEFMTKKDYIDNWRSELNEEFSFMSFSDWKDVLKQIGFSIVENPNEPQASSRAYANQWIVDNRFKGKTELFEMQGGTLVSIAFPETNMVLVAEKPLS